jgi:hypothetical protein
MSTRQGGTSYGDFGVLLGWAGILDGVLMKRIRRAAGARQKKQNNWHQIIHVQVLRDNRTRASAAASLA